MKHWVFMEFNPRFLTNMDIFVMDVISYVGLGNVKITYSWQI